MKVEAIMSTPVITTDRNTTVGQLRTTFSQQKFSAAPVIEEDGTITGIVSSRDLAICHDDNALVQDIMSERVHIAVKNNLVKDAADMMLKNGVHHLVVMEEGRVVGMLSSMDMVRLVAEK